MSGNPDGKLNRRGALTRRSSLLLGVVAAILAAAGALAFVTAGAPPLPARRAAKSSPVKAQVEPSPQAPAFGSDMSLPPAPPAPPPPTSADIGDDAPAAPSPPAAAGDTSAKSDPASLPIEELKNKANQNDPPSMAEMARRLILGIGIAKDPEAGAGWMLRAAELGSMQAAFNVGVMYESGFVVPRDSSRAAQWYRKAADAGVAAAQHNLALLLREGKGVPRDGAQAIKLLQAAAHQGMTASMFTLGDIYEQGDAAPKDFAAALAWYAITAEFERQSNGGKETPLAKVALQRSQALQRVLTPAELQRARELGEREIRTIARTMSPPRAGTATDTALLPAGQVTGPAADWPSGVTDQVRAVQQALFDLKLLADKPDGVLGPVTRTAITTFQRSAGLAPTGEATKAVYVALRNAIARRDATTPGIGLPAAALPSPSAAPPAPSKGATP